MCSFVWGMVTDWKGKKFTCIFATICLTLTTLAFGFSKSVWWATITRFLQGSAMGLPIAAKALTASLCDDTNIALGMSVHTSAFTIGLIIGPSLAGKYRLFNFLCNYKGGSIHKANITTREFLSATKLY